MIIHVVQSGENIYSIAEKYNFPVERLIIDNVIDPNKLAIGLPIIIAYPLETYIVQEGDSLESIARDKNIPVMQLLRNNNFLFDRLHIFPGESLVISYENTKGDIITNGYVNEFVDLKTFERTLPYLTYVSIFGYQPTVKGEIKQIKDDELLSMAKSYSVAPLMFVSGLSVEGVSDPQIIFDILANDELTSKIINHSIEIIKEKGYYGLNMSYLYININNIKIYENFTKKLITNYKSNGLKLFLTFNINTIKENIMDKFDNSILKDIDGITFINFSFGKNTGPPAPITSIKVYNDLLKVATEYVPSNKISIASQLISYDWELPYIEGESVAYSLKVSTAFELAFTTKSVIQFDDISKTPFFNYIEQNVFSQSEHIVWFTDVRTLDEITNLIVQYDLQGTGIWNIMYYFNRMWMVYNSQCKIIKLFPEK